jgi:HAD superfamily phosphatase (TIGR01668 family)
MIAAVIFDFGRTLYDSETEELYPEALPLLEKLQERGLKMALVSRTQDPERRREDLKRLGIDNYFKAIEVFPAHQAKEFDKVFSDLGGVSPEECLVVGDRIQSEILEGNRAGCITAWIKQGKFIDEEPRSGEEQPDYTIHSLMEVLSILDEQIT